MPQEPLPLTVLIVMPLAEQRGGSEQALLQLIDHGRPSDVAWHVVFLRDGPMLDQVRQLGGSAWLVNAGRLREPILALRAIRRIAKLASDHRCDAIVGWSAKANLYAAPAGRLAGIPSCWFQHGMPNRRGWLDRFATLMPTNGVMACSNAVRDRQAALWPRRQVVTVYPGVDLHRYDVSTLPAPEECRRRFRLDQAAPLIGIVGRLQRWKGMHRLVEVMPEILNEYPEAMCVIVGGPHDLEPGYPTELAETIDQLGLPGRILMAGYQPNVAEWMQAMDVVVHASDEEPFGMVVIEAMALGKLVVASRTAGPSEIIQDGVNGYLWDTTDTRNLGIAIRRSLGDRQDRRMAEHAAARAREFDVRIYASNVIRAVREFVGQGSRALGV